MSPAAVMVVEDEAIVAADLAGMLKRLGYVVAGIAATGEEAVAMVLERRPQLVLMDIQLAGALDGIQAAGAIQQRQDVPVVYLTAHSDGPTLTRAKRSGPVGYILKPFEERELATQIELALFKHRSDHRLREQREWLRTTLNSIADAVIATDADARVSFVNPVAAGLTEWEAETAAGKPLADIFRLVDERTGASIPVVVDQVAPEKRPIPLNSHAVLITRTGATIPIENSVAPILSADDQLLGMVLVFRDVTEKRRAQKVLREREQRYRSVFSNNHAIMMLIDPEEGKIVDANPAACRYYGYPLETITTLTMADINTLPPDQIRSRMVLTESTRGQHLFFKHRLADGRVRDVEVFSGPIVFDNRRLLYSIVYDVTERKLAEEALKRSEQRLKRAEEIAHLGSWEFDLVDDALIWSDEVFRIFGLSPTHFGGTYEAFLAAVHPEDREMVGDGYRQSVKGCNRTYDIAHRIVRPDGEIRHVYEKCEHHRDETGRVIRSVGMVHDVTEEHEIRIALERSNRELAEFAYVASHDLQAPLRAVVGFLQLLKARYDDRLDEKGRHYIDRAVSATDRMQTLIRDLLVLSQVSSREKAFAPANLDRIVKNVLDDLGQIIQDRQVAVVSEPLPELTVDASQIESLFQNLIMNAIKYNEAAHPRIEIGCREADNHYRFFVRDNGIGIPPQFHERIFVLFQRLHTDREYPGTGMGLALCKKIVERHGGTIGVEARPGAGSTFCFTLPKKGGLHASRDAP